MRPRAGKFRARPDQHADIVHAGFGIHHRDIRAVGDEILHHPVAHRKILGRAAILPRPPQLTLQRPHRIEARGPGHPGIVDHRKPQRDPLGKGDIGVGLLPLDQPLQLHFGGQVRLHRRHHPGPHPVIAGEGEVHQADRQQRRGQHHPPPRQVAPDQQDRQPQQQRQHNRRRRRQLVVKPVLALQHIGNRRPDGEHRQRQQHMAQKRRVARQRFAVGPVQHQHHTLAEQQPAAFPHNLQARRVGAAIQRQG